MVLPVTLLMSIADLLNADLNLYNISNEFLYHLCPICVLDQNTTMKQCRWGRNQKAAKYGDSCV